MSRSKQVSRDKDSGANRVLIATDVPLAIVGIKVVVHEVLAQTQFVEVHDGQALVKAISREPTLSLAVIDLQMRNMSHGRRLEEIAALRTDVPLIVLSSITPPEILQQVMNTPNVFALLLKSANTAAVRAAIQAALARQRFYGASLRTQAPRARPRLTPRQKQICALVRRGMSNAAIATALRISKGTVRNHITKILTILKARERSQLAHMEIDSD